MVAKPLATIFWQRRWALALTFLLAMGGSVAYLAVAPRIYSSEARIYLEQAGPKILTETPGGLGRTDTYLYDQVELIKSTGILEAALQDPAVAGIRTFSGRQDAVSFLRDKLSVDVAKKASVLSVSFESPYREDPAPIVNSVVNAYLRSRSPSQAAAGDVLKVLEKERADRTVELAGLAKGLAEFKRTHPVLSYADDKNSNIVIQRLARLSDALTTAQLAALEAKSRYDSAQALAHDASKIRELIGAQHANTGSAESKSMLDTLRGQLYALQAQLASVRMSVPPGSKTIRSIEATIEELQARIVAVEQEYVAAYLAALEQEQQRRTKEFQDIQTAFEAQQKEATTLNATAAEFARLSAESNRAEKLCDLLDGRIKELQLGRSAGTLNVSVLEAGVVPGRPSKPSKPLVLAVGAALGLFLGMGLAMWRDRMDQRMWSAVEIQTITGMPVLGVVPHLGGKSAPALGQQTHCDPLSDMAEAVRSVRATIQYAAAQDLTKTIAVTSPAPSAGKSTFTANLAIALARIGRRVLVLDADLRNPSQHIIFQAPDTGGLAHAINSLEQAQAFIFRTEIKHLDLLLAGTQSATAVELLTTSGFARLLERLAKDYDHVLVDSPPLGPVSDARVLAALCGMTILVVRADQSLRSDCQAARDSLQGVGANVLGVVINDAPPRTQRYSGYDNNWSRYQAQNQLARVARAETVKNDTSVGPTARLGTP